MSFCLCLVLGSCHPAGTWKQGGTLCWGLEWSGYYFIRDPFMLSSSCNHCSTENKRDYAKINKFPAIGSLSKAESLRCLFHSDLQASKMPSKLYLACASTQQIIRFGREQQDLQNGKCFNSSLETFSPVCPNHFIQSMSTSYLSTLI